MSPIGKAVTIRDLIDQMAALQVGQPFIISPETGRVITYDGLQRQLLHISGYFRGLGLSAGDKIGLLTDNGLSAIQLFLGAMYSGLVCVPLNVRAGLSHLSFMLNDCDAKVIFVADNYDKLGEQALTDVQRPIRLVAANIDDLPDAADLSPMLGALSPITSEDPALLIYSSGSTGLPKGAVHSHRSVLAHGRNAAQSHELTTADRSLLVLPLYHINAECVTLMPTLTAAVQWSCLVAFWSTNFGTGWMITAAPGRQWCQRSFRNCWTGKIREPTKERACSSAFASCAHRRLHCRPRCIVSLLTNSTWC